MLVDLQPEAIQRSGEVVEFRVTIDPALDLLPDHFPGYPMLPGVVQLGWAVRAAQAECDMPGALERVAALKFMQPIRPGQQVTLRLERLGPAEVSFSYRHGAHVHSSGKLRFSDDAA